MVVHSGQKSERFIVDSGASKHICCRRDWFQTLESSKETLQVGNEEWVHAQGIGNIIIRSELESGYEDIELKNVLYIPDMCYNLFSTGKAADHGCSTVIDSQGCKIIFYGRIVMRGSLDESLGVCFLDVTVRTGVAFLVSTRRTLEEWHRAFGHADTQVLKEMASGSIVDGL